MTQPKFALGAAVLAAAVAGWSALRAGRGRVAAEAEAAARADEALAAHDAARRARLSQAAILGRLGAGVLTFAAGGRITGANELFLAMTGLPASAVVGRDMSSPMWPSAGPAEFEELRAIASEHGVGASEWVLQRQSGEAFVADVVLAALPDGSLVATVSDTSKERARRLGLARERDHAAAAADLVAEDLARVRQRVGWLTDETRRAQEARGEAERASDVALARAEIAATLLRSPRVEDRARVALEAIAEHAGAEIGAVYLGAEDASLTASLGDGSLPERIGPADGVMRRAIVDREPQFVPGVGPMGPPNASAGPDAWELHVPLAAGRDPVGLLSLASSSAPQAGVEALAELAKDAGRVLVSRGAEAGVASDALLGVVSREMRTPLTSVSGYLQDALEVMASDGDDEGLSFLEAAHRNAVRLEQLVDDLMTLSDVGALDAPSAGDIDLADVVNEACAQAAPEALRLGVELAMLIDSAAPAPGDDRSLARAVENLIWNALRFTPAGGRVDVAVGVRGTHVVVEVADNGLDLAEEDLSDVFDPDHPGPVSSRASLGAGFGLAVVKAVAMAHGGEVVVEGGEGEGATFRISLPAAEPGGGPASSEARSASAS